MLSRVANSLYWLARYLERAENGARFLACNHEYAQELRGVSHAAADAAWKVARELMAPELVDEETGPKTFHRLAYDETLPHSIISSVLRARENARGIRDAIPSEMWEELNMLFLLLREEAQASHSDSAELSLLVRMKNASLLFSGLRDNTMVREDEWHFLRLGHFLERADGTCRLLKVMYTHPAIETASESGQNIDLLHLATTLKMCTGREAYYRAGNLLETESVAEFLLLDALFPHSADYCVQEISNSLHALSGTAQDIFTNPAEQVVGRLVADLRFASIEEIMAAGFEDHLTGILSKLNQLARAISEQYFR